MNRIKTSKIAIIVGCLLLLVMGVFHGSGIFYITDKIDHSNLDSLLKEIVPVLFAHPSIHLLGLVAFGILSLFLKHEVKKVVFTIAVLVVIDAILAFYLGATIPALLLLTGSSCFVLAGILGKK